MLRDCQFRRTASVFLLVLTLVLSNTNAWSAVQAAPITPQAALVRVLTVSPLQASWFAPSFLAQVSIGQAQQALDGLNASFGSYTGISALPDGTFKVRFQYGSVHASIHLDGQGRIDGLLFTDAQFSYVSRSAALTALQHMPGHVSLLVLANGSPREPLHPDTSLAVGSAFKLAVLTALQQRIVAHQLSWTQMVTLHVQDKSFPSGILQTKPNGSRYTVADLARYMISISDNTAADLLIHVVGRATIDPLIPKRDRPILTTHEAFVLKDPAHRDLRDRYLATKDVGERLLILQQLDRLPLLDIKSATRLVGAGLISPQVEWFFSTRQLCQLISAVAQLPQMSVNPGVANPAEWAHVAYKGGSEPGVLNLTTLVTAHNGTRYCVSATWNNSAVLDEPRFEFFYGSVLHSYH